jgi:glycosyltransferase involved in cell wall biosynthesis
MKKAKVLVDARKAEKSSVMSRIYFFDERKKKETVVENLFKHKTYNCVRYRCIQNKLLLSLVGTVEAYFYRLKRIWQHIDLFICPSNFMKDKMVEWGFPGAKMRVAFNPFKEVKQTLPLGKKIVYIGRIHYEKGIKFLLEAARELKEYEFVIAGIGPDEVWVDTYIKENNLVNVRRHGWVEGEKWLSVMKEAKVVVLPTIVYENCSVNILEALSYGRLVVASNRGGNPEMIIDGKSGFLAKPEDSKDLVKKIRQAVELVPEEASRIVEYAQKNILPRYQLDVHLDALEKVYQELV